MLVISHRPICNSPGCSNTSVCKSSTRPVDRLSMDWANLPLAYAFPPTLIIPKVLLKIQNSNAAHGDRDSSCLAKTVLVCHAASTPSGSPCETPSGTRSPITTDNTPGGGCIRQQKCFIIMRGSYQAVSH